MAANVRHSAASTEWYSPNEVVELARSLMGAIDLDPFSCDEAQRVVRAGRHWTLAGARGGGPNGFTSPWGRASDPSRAFVNAPGGTVGDAGFPIVATRRDVACCQVSGSCGAAPGHLHVGRRSAQKWAWRRTVEEWRAGRVSQAVFLCFSLELLQTSQSDAAGGDLLPTDFPLCYPRKRLAYRRPQAAGGSEVGESPPHASCVVYLPPRDGWRDATESGLSLPDEVSRFKSLFSSLGRVVVPR